LPGSLKVCRQDAGDFTVDGKAYPLLSWTAKAKASYRTIPLPPEVVAKLRRFKAKSKSRYVFLSLKRLEIIAERLHRGTWLPNGLPMNNLIRQYRAIQAAAHALLANRRGVSVEKVTWRIGTFHDLRDSYIMRIKNGVSLDVLQRIAGHENLATTLKYYTQPTQADAAQVLSALAGKRQVQGTNRAHLTGTDA
ncbi:MAG: site-specific integrase, partial [Planctomycetota bacterium]|nr:site-specific integrase [Planctomycetota bacterium]